MTRTGVLAFAVFAATAGTAMAQTGDAQKGEMVAREVCAQCHGIARDSASPNPMAPPFPAIASTPGMTDTALLVALRTPHIGGTMPLVLPNNTDLADVIAYIGTLRQR
jgi:mono/diheme cytochrome c family protein